MSESEGLDHAEGEPACFAIASSFEVYAHVGPGVCLSNGRTEAEGVPSQGGRGDTLLRRMPHSCRELIEYEIIDAQDNDSTFQKSRSGSKGTRILRVVKMSEIVKY